MGCVGVCGVSWPVFGCGLGVWGIWGVGWARLRGEGVTAGVFGVLGASVGYRWGVGWVRIGRGCGLQM